MDEMRVYLISRKPGQEDYTGAWFSCPVDIDEVMEKLEIESPEQVEIADSELPFSIRWNISLWELNMDCDVAMSMAGTPLGENMKAIIGKWFDGDLYDFMDHKEDICYYAVQDPEALARHLLQEEHVCGDIPDKVCDYIDYAAYGRELEADERYLFIPGGTFYYS